METHGRIRAGDLEVEVHCDTRQLDEAIAKVTRLIELGTRAQELGVLPAGAMVVPAVLASASRQKISRRNLIRFGFKRD